MLRRLLTCVLLSALPSVAAAAFVIGVPPIHSMRVLAERYEPLRAHLQERLGRPVVVESAPDFVTYQNRTLHADFDLTVTPAHLARLAQKDAGFQPLVQFRPDHDALLVSDVARPLTHVGLLKGRQLAVIDPLAVTVLAMLHHLERQGMVAGRDFSVVGYHNHASVVQAVAAGQALAGVTTTHGMQQVPKGLRAKMRVMARLTGIPAFVILAKPDLAPTQVDHLRRLLLEFSHDEAGKAFFQGIAFSGFVPADAKRLERVDAYLEETRRGLGR